MTWNRDREDGRRARQLRPYAFQPGVTLSNSNCGVELRTIDRSRVAVTAPLPDDEPRLTFSTRRRRRPRRVVPSSLAAPVAHSPGRTPIVEYRKSQERHRAKLAARRPR